MPGSVRRSTPRSIGGVVAAVAPVIVLAAWAAGCLGTPEFRCEDHAQCGPGAFCEMDGRCSLPDPSCPSRRRYVESAGPDSGACVGPTCAANPPVSVAAGGGHACLARQDGSVLCWGRNDHGQLGDGTRTPRARAVRAVNLSDAVAVAAGNDHTCAIRRNRSVVCWGADDRGQLGDAAATPAGGAADRLLPGDVPGLELGALSIAAGADFSCAVLADGTARCWGDDARGQLGDGAPSDAARGPVPVFALDGARAIAGGARHACVVRDDESLWCWGANDEGQLGTGSSADVSAPTRVPGLTEVTVVAAGLSHTCAVTRAAGLYCWGSNESGELGSTEGSAVPTPARVPIVTDPISVAAGVQYSCAVRKTGGVYCWGQNGAGQLGQGGTSNLAAPVAVAGLVTGVTVVAGGTFACAVTSDEAIMCWGDDHDGQLGGGDAEEPVRPSPVKVAGISRARLVAAGGAHTCAASDADDPASGALTSRRTTSCWGGDQAGQLGDGVTADRSRPLAVAVDVAAATLTAGGAHSCAVSDGDGALWCWGRGGSGQLGLGANHLFDVRLPAQVPLTGTSAAASAGDAHTCAIVSNGGGDASGGAPPANGGPAGVVCFGSNDHGQLGNGTTVSGSTAGAPFGLPGGSTPVAIASGGAHSCVLDDNGRAFCWGRGDDGQVGDGASSDRAAPVAVVVPDGTRLTALSAGGAHSCALDDAGHALCWGRGRDGQLGLGPNGPGGAPTATVVPGLIGLRAIAAGGAHTCAVDGAGGVRCWGANDDGQLGTGDTAASDAPQPVGALGGIVQLTAGAAHTCAVDADGSTWCWGANDDGQLGDGRALFSPTPRLARVACQ